MNLLADMGAQPSSLQVGADPARPLWSRRRLIRHLRADVDDHLPDRQRHGRKRQPRHHQRHRDRHRRRHRWRRGSVGRRRHHLARRRRARRRGRFDWTPGVRRHREHPHAARLTTAATWKRPAPASPCRSIVGECPCTSLWKPSAIPANRQRERRRRVRARRQVQERHRRLHHRHPVLQGTRQHRHARRQPVVVDGHAAGERDLHQRDRHRAGSR